MLFKKIARRHDVTDADKVVEFDAKRNIYGFSNFVNVILQLYTQNSSQRNFLMIYLFARYLYESTWDDVCMSDKVSVCVICSTIKFIAAKSFVIKMKSLIFYESVTYVACCES